MDNFKDTFSFVESEQSRKLLSGNMEGYHKLVFNFPSLKMYFWNNFPIMFPFQTSEDNQTQLWVWSSVLYSLLFLSPVM